MKRDTMKKTLFLLFFTLNSLVLFAPPKIEEFPVFSAINASSQELIADVKLMNENHRFNIPAYNGLIFYQHTDRTFSSTLIPFSQQKLQSSQEEAKKILQGKALLYAIEQSKIDEQKRNK